MPSVSFTPAPPSPPVYPTASSRISPDLVPPGIHATSHQTATPSAVARFDAQADESQPTRAYFQRLHEAPSDSGRRWTKVLWPALGLLVIVAGVAFLSYRSSSDDGLSGGLVNPSVDEMAQATVQILGLDGDDNPICSGSGTFVSTDGMILTNAHVITRDNLCNFASIGVAVTTDASLPPALRYHADLLTIDRDLDLAVIKVARTIDSSQAMPPSFLALALGDSDELGIGDPLQILGYPEIGGETITFTRGTVSGFTAQANIGDRALIKTDATIAGGNSGGAAVNTEGQLIGIPTKARASENGPAVDCRPLADTNNDGTVDDGDNCVPIGGFLNGLRPVNLAREVIKEARSATPQPFESSTLAVPVDPGTIKMSQPRFSLGHIDNKPAEIVRTAIGDVPELCLFVDWAGIPDGAIWEAYWFYNGDRMDDISVPSKPWHFGDEGANFWVCAKDEEKGLAAGLYELGFFVGGNLIFAEGIVLTDSPALLVSTTWKNDSGVEICGLAVNPEGSGPVGLSELPPGTQLMPGQSVNLDLAPGKVVVEAYDCNGQPLADSGGQSIKVESDKVYTINQGLLPQQ